MRKAIIFAVLLVTGGLMAHGNQDESQGPAKGQKRQLTAQGCVSRSIDRYILMQPDQGHSYGLEATRKIKFDHYLGQHVDVTGSKSPTLNTSSTSRTTIAPAENHHGGLDPRHFQTMHPLTGRAGLPDAAKLNTGSHCSTLIQRCFLRGEN